MTLHDQDSDKNASPAPGRLTDAQYMASRSTLWSGVSALFTDDRGRVLLEDVDYRPACLLPGGAMDAGEPPSLTVAREVYEELGLTRSFSRPLAVDWVPPSTPGYPPPAFPAKSSTSSTVAP
ncbi:NUDIX domain-containing protein [Streptomyces sp. XH2]|uniref:NUDIX domain-containing protein n=1 Tax=Streptomyces sp. XH2 TaxID=3412483 RepID=UPI003C7D62A3